MVVSCADSAVGPEQQRPAKRGQLRELRTPTACRPRTWAPALQEVSERDDGAARLQRGRESEPSHWSNSPENQWPGLVNGLTHDSLVIELSWPLCVQKLEVDIVVWSSKVVLC